MTELLHPVPTEPSSATVLDASGTVAPPTDLPDDAQTSRVWTTRYERESATLDDALAPGDLAAMPIRQLRVMVNQAYKLMDTDYPPSGAVERYEMIVVEIEHRARQATDQGVGSGSGSAHQLKETFRDNSLYCRFELIIDGDIAASVKYTMSGSQIVLIGGVEQPEFRDQGIDETLMRHIVLNTHKRRLGLVPGCPMASTFLANNPQYRVLTGQPGR